MKTIARLAGLFLLGLLTGAALAQTNLSFNASWTNNPNGLAACTTPLQNCFADTTVVDTTPATPLLLCTGTGLATSCKGTGVVVPANWPYGTAHTVSYTAQYYGATTGTLLSSTAATLSVENLIVQAPGAPSAPSGTITVSLISAPLAGRGWLMYTPETESFDLTTQIGG
jgi:hypothetical protein